MPSRGMLGGGGVGLFALCNVCDYIVVLYHPFLKVATYYLTASYTSMYTSKGAMQLSYCYLSIRSSMLYLTARITEV